MRALGGSRNEGKVCYAVVRTSRCSASPNSTPRNEGKVCYAVVRRFLDARERMLRAEVVRPETLGDAAQVDLQVRIGSQVYAVEHTRMEAFPNQARADRQFTEVIGSVEAARPKRCRAMRCTTCSCLLTVALAGNRTDCAWRRRRSSGVCALAERLTDGDCDAFPASPRGRNTTAGPPGR